MQPTSTSGSSTKWTRDKDYYFEDGSCILLAEDVLFNVHRSILSRDGSTFFGTLFSVPQGEASCEGSSDEHPIVLEGESATEFRSFLFALYALPPELQVLTSPVADLPALISIARKSNKFDFRSLERWALKAIQDYVNRQPSPILDSVPSPTSYVYSPKDTKGLEHATDGSRSTAHLTRLISLAQLCGHAPLLNTMINTLKELMSSSIQYAYLAMTLSDELNLKALRGPAYLEVMQKAEIVKPLELDLSWAPSPSTSSSSSLPSSTSHSAPPANGNTLVIGAMANALAPLTSGPAIFTNSSITSSGASSTGSSLSASPLHISSTSTGARTRAPVSALPITTAQQLRLLSGYYRLAHTWDLIRLTPPSFEHAPACATTWHQHGCTQAWLEFWKDKTTKSDSVLSLGAADVLGRLKAIQKEYERWGSAAYMHNECRVSARKRIGEVVGRVEESLSDYFAGVGEVGV